jgi:hypothetical protein
MLSRANQWVDRVRQPATWWGRVGGRGAKEGMECLMTDPTWYYDDVKPWKHGRDIPPIAETHPLRYGNITTSVGTLRVSAEHLASLMDLEKQLQRIRACADILELPDSRRPEFTHLISDFLNKAASLTKPIAASVPLSAGLAWPTEKWETSPEKAFHKHHAIVAFLRRVWKPFIEENNVIVTRAVLQERDAAAAKAVEKYLQYNPLPKDIPIITSKQLREHLRSRPVSADSLPALRA